MKFSLRTRPDKSSRSFREGGSDVQSTRYIKLVLITPASCSSSEGKSLASVTNIDNQIKTSTEGLKSRVAK